MYDIKASNVFVCMVLWFFVGNMAMATSQSSGIFLEDSRKPLFFCSFGTPKDPKNGHLRPDFYTPRMEKRNDVSRRILGLRPANESL